MSNTESLLSRYVHDRATQQEVLVAVRTALLAQGRRSMTPIGCAYRSPDGSRCAVGALMSDAELDWVETADLNNSVNSDELVAVLYAANTPCKSDRMAFLSELQSCHDNAEDHHRPFATGLMEELEELARRYGLS